MEGRFTQLLAPGDPTTAFGGPGVYFPLGGPGGGISLQESVCRLVRSQSLDRFSFIGWEGSVSDRVGIIQPKANLFPYYSGPHNEFLGIFWDASPSWYIDSSIYKDITPLSSLYNRQTQ